MEIIQNSDLEFKISYKSNLDNSKCKNLSTSITGCVTYLTGRHFCTGALHKDGIIVGNWYRNVCCFVYNIVKLLELILTLPMKVEIDNCCTVYLTNGWTIDGLT